MHDPLDGRRVAIPRGAALHVAHLALGRLRQGGVSAPHGARLRSVDDLASDAGALRAQRDALAPRECRAGEDLFDAAGESADVGVGHLLPLARRGRPRAVDEAVVHALRGPLRRQQLPGLPDKRADVGILPIQHLVEQHQAIAFLNESADFEGDDVVHVAEPTVETYELLLDVEVPQRHARRVLDVGQQRHRGNGVRLLGVGHVVQAAGNTGVCVGAQPTCEGLEPPPHAIGRPQEEQGVARPIPLVKVLRHVHLGCRLVGLRGAISLASVLVRQLRGGSCCWSREGTHQKGHWALDPNHVEVKPQYRDVQL
mmetsp:Transcript_47155/g.135098  ORF Transcript_47155/g.135098 Transcript_47155/m.135098 type:complete len:312 (-) Transcript_47155:1288-2223(-)